MDTAPEMQKVVRRIAERWNPEKIYLYNRRLGLLGNTTAFKLCLILRTPDKSAVEREIYLSVDSGVPFDVLLYTPEEWEVFLQDPASFAYKIRENGVILYE